MQDSELEDLHDAPAAGSSAGDPLRLFSIPAGAEFIPVLVEALLSQKLIPGFPASGDPLALADARIFVPTRRAAKALASEIARQLGGGSAILPQILPLGALAETGEASLLDPAAYPAFADLAGLQAMPEMERRLVLTELILNWSRQIRNAILSIEPDGRIVEHDNEPFVVTSAPGQAFHLAGELGALIDEMIIEGIDWRALHKLAPDDFDRYWSITLEFLKIAMEHWPDHLAESGRVDSAHRNVLLAEAEAERLMRERPDAPYIVAGSTGTNAATAQLMGAVARLPKGAVVLPGVDLSLDEKTWAMLPIASDDKKEAAGEADGAAGHPQAALARLLSRLGVARDVVQPLGAAAEDLQPRLDFLAQALLPPAATDRWSSYRREQGDAATGRALSGLTYMDASDERQEALAIAIAMREVLETPDRTAALITPDRKLAHRVRSELLRWNIAIDDSGGEILKDEPVGVLARLALQLAQGPFAAAAGSSSDAAPDPITLIALLHHDRLRLGYDETVLHRIAALVECGVLRGPVLVLNDLQHCIEKARTLAGDPYAHALKKQIDDAGWSDIADCLSRLQEAFAPMTCLRGEHGLQTWFAALQDVLRALLHPADGDIAQSAADDEALQALILEFMAAPERSIRLSLREFAAFFETVTQETKVRGPLNAHPRLKILGLLEARLLSADLKILAGMDEGIWPPAARTDAFLNRPMRDQLGLSPPERRIGQTAHDFVEAMGARDVIITRSRKRDGAPAIPSRLIQRMAALAGEGVWQACCARGEEYLNLATALDRAAEVHPAPRPEPRPPVALRPSGLSVTQIETWRRDPYSIYAAKILRLQPLDEPGVTSTAAEIGNALHRTIELYQAGVPAGESSEQAQQRIAAIAADVFAELLQDANIRTFRWPRILTALAGFVDWEMARRAGVAMLLAEQTGALDIPLEDGTSFRLSARADRIEKTADGAAILVDYKSSHAPSQKTIEAGFGPQLTLEGAIVQRGGFKALPDGTAVARAMYLKLLGRDGIDESGISEKRGANRTLQDLIDEHYDGLVALANQFRREETAYVPRPYPQFTHAFSDYDHLARVKEWAAGTEGDGS
jgi:ATP-dependent helicase/nuclease subunit B